MQIQHLILHSHQLSAQEDFYHHRLGFVGESEKDRFTLQTRENVLEFISSDTGEYYHFAFLIPTGSLESAMDFLEEREIDILKTGEEEKIMHFHPGRAIYFYDSDGNIVEFIERPELSYPTQKDFSIEDVIKVNEIGFPVKDPGKSARVLMAQYGIQPENPEGFSENFCWVGDADGVIITVKEGRPWLPVDKPGIPNEFRIRYTASGQNYFLHIRGNQIVLLDKRPC